MRQIDCALGNDRRSWAILHGKTHRFAPRLQRVMPGPNNRTASPDMLSVCGAWLGQCWRGDGAAWPPMSACDGDLMTYGDHVIHVLLDRGLTPLEIVTTAAELFTAAAQALPGMEEVQATANFIEPAAAGSTAA